MPYFPRPLLKIAMACAALAGPFQGAALAQITVPFSYGDNGKAKQAPPAPEDGKFAAVTALLEKKGYHRLPGERFRNANGPALPFNAPAGQHAEVAVPGPGCTGSAIGIEDQAARKRYKGQPVGPGLAVFLNYPRDTDVLVTLRADNPFCVIYLLGYQR